MNIFLLLILVLTVVLFSKSCANFENYTQKILVDVPPNRSPLVTVPGFQKIPKIIMQTNERSVVPIGMRSTMDSIIEDNPDYGYIYFDDQEAKKFLQNNFPKEVADAYDSLKPGAYKADLFRHCFLYKNGGVYIDTGMVSKTPLRQLINPMDEFICPEDGGTFGLYNAFICCVPLHPIMKATIDITVSNVQNKNYGTDVLDITGPLVLANAFKSVTGMPVVPDKTYPKHIRTIAHKGGIHKYSHLTSAGEILSSNVVFFITKYPTYYDDGKWYHTKKHYGIMWHERDVFQ